MERLLGEHVRRHVHVRVAYRDVVDGKELEPESCLATLDVGHWRADGWLADISSCVLPNLRPPPAAAGDCCFRFWGRYLRMYEWNGVPSSKVSLVSGVRCGRSVVRQGAYSL